MILAECHADTLLAKMLLPEFDVDRSCNIGAVSNRFQKYYNNRKAIGIIDKDKNIGRIFKQFKKYSSNDLPNMIHLWDEQKHHLIYFKEGLESFMHESAIQAAIDINSKYSKFSSTQQIRIYTKTIQVDNNFEFRNFLNDIKNRNPDNFKTFINWVIFISKL